MCYYLRKKIFFTAKNVCSKKAFPELAKCFTRALCIPWTFLQIKGECHDKGLSLTYWILEGGTSPLIHEYLERFFPNSVFDAMIKNSWEVNQRDLLPSTFITTYGFQMSNLNALLTKLDLRRLPNVGNFPYVLQIQNDAIVCITPPINGVPFYRKNNQADIESLIG